jgi:hypothetical protein
MIKKKLTYSIKATIPTGPYANIIPEITVEADTLDEASALVLPHIELLYMKYLNYTERRQPYTPPVVAIKPPVVAEVNVGTVIENPVSTAFEKAKTAVETCRSTEALEMIIEQIKKSVKLTDKEKDAMFVITINKQKEFNGEPAK